MFGDRYNYQINKCHTISKKLAFALKTYRFYVLTVFLVFVVLISLLIGFTYLGNMKGISNYDEISRDIRLGTIVVAFMSGPLIIWVLRVFNRSLNATEKFNVDATSSEINRVKSQIMAGLTTSGFITGNVCYETIFSEANSDKIWENRTYFFILVLSFAFGMSTIIVSSLILFCSGELPSFDKKAYFVVTLRPVKLWIFVLSLGSLLSWQATLLLMSAAKYTGEKGGYWRSIIPGVIGLVAIFWYYCVVKKISDDVLINGRTLTTAAASEKMKQTSSCSPDDTRESFLRSDQSTILNPLVIEERNDNSVTNFEVELA